jgi:hypothetical protein
LIKLRPEEKQMHVITMSPSGHMYVTDGKDACTEVIDLGQGAGFRSPMVLADDLSGNGMLDLIATSGMKTVFSLSTETPYHPLNTWREEAHGRNVYTTTLHQGIYFLPNYRVHRDIVGDEFWMEFEIVDNRKTKNNAYYDVQIKLRRDLDPIFTARYSFPGVKSVMLRAPADCMSGTVRIEMTNEHLQFFHDSVSLTFNLKFYRSIKVCHFFISFYFDYLLILIFPLFFFSSG